MDNKKPLHLLPESCRDSWSLRNIAYKRVRIFFTKKQKIIASLHFDIEGDGLFIPRKAMCEILQVKPKALSAMIGRMDRVASLTLQELWDKKYLGV